MVGLMMMIEEKRICSKIFAYCRIRQPNPIPDAVRSELIPKPESSSETELRYRSRHLSYQIYYLLALTKLV
jgi:hypothetical protein